MIKIVNVRIINCIKNVIVYNIIKYLYKWIYKKIESIVCETKEELVRGVKFSRKRQKDSRFVFNRRTVAKLRLKIDAWRKQTVSLIRASSVNILSRSIRNPLVKKYRKMYDCGWTMHPPISISMVFLLKLFCVRTQRHYSEKMIASRLVTRNVEMVLRNGEGRTDLFFR